MSSSLKRSRLVNSSALLIAFIIIGWAVTAISGAAHLPFNRQRASATAPQNARSVGQSGDTALRPRNLLPATVRLRESQSRGLLASVWVNETGPYTFAVDTGAGATILSPRVAGAARVTVEGGEHAIRVGGLSGMSAPGGRKAFLTSLAIGFRENHLPSKGLTIVAEGLPPDVDGILDPTEAFSPFGYMIDMPRGLLSVFDPRATPVRRSDASAQGAVVEWLSDSNSRRPFVMLKGGRRALLDTGSGFGLAVTAEAAQSLGIVTGGGRARDETRDLAGGSVASRRIMPATVYLGALALRGVPADLLLRAEAEAPILLGRDALRPFRLTFDPLNRLIHIEP